MEVVKILRNFLDGTGGARDWDNFISVEIEDKDLEQVRLRCLFLGKEFPSTSHDEFCAPEGLEVVRELISQLSS